MNIIKYDDFINEGIKDNKYVSFIKNLLLRGILPAFIVYQLKTHFSEPRAESIVKYYIENYEDPANIFKDQISYAKSIALKKCEKFKNYEELKSKILLLPIRIGAPRLGPTDMLASLNFDSNGHCILINSIHVSEMNDHKLKEALSHEYFHYIDFLIGKNNLEYSNNNKDIRNIIDIDISIDDVKKRVSLFYFLKPEMSKLTKNELIEVNDISKQIFNKKEYYTSDEEVYARLNSLRRSMFDLDIINDINQNLTKENMSDFFKKSLQNKNINNFINSDFVSLFIFIKFDSYTTLRMNRIALVNNKYPNNLS